MFFVCKDKRNIVNLEDLQFVWIDDNGFTKDLGIVRVIADCKGDVRYTLGEYENFEQAQEALLFVAKALEEYGLVTHMPD